MPVDSTRLTILVAMKDLATSGFLRLKGIGSKILGGLASGFKLIFGAVTKVVKVLAVMGGIIAAIAVRHLVKMAQRLDDIAKTAVRLNTTVESLQQFEFVAGIAGVTIQELNKGVIQFSRNLDLAQEGTLTQARAFQALGIDIRQVRTGSLDLAEVFGQVADGLKLIESPTKRTAVLMDIFGRSGAQMATIFAQGSDGIRELAAEAEKLGFIIGGEQLQNVEAMNDAWFRVKLTLRGIADFIALTFVPFITEKLTQLKDFILENRDEILEGILEFAEGVAKIVDQVGPALLKIIAGLTSAIELLTGVFSSVLTLMELINVGFVKLTGTQRDYEEAVDRWLAQSSLTAEAFSVFSAGVDRQIIQLPKLVEGMAAVRAEFEAFQAGAAVDPDKTLPGVLDIKPDVVTKWGQFLKGIKKGLGEIADKWNDLFEIGRQMITQLSAGFVNNLSGAITDVVLSVKSAKDAFRDFGNSVLRILVEMIARLLVIRFLMSALSPLGALGLDILGSSPAANNALDGIAAAGRAPFQPGRSFGDPRGGEVVEVHLTIVANDPASFDNLLHRSGKTIEDLVARSIQTRRDLRLEVRR